MKREGVDASRRSPPSPKFPRIELRLRALLEVAQLHRAPMTLEQIVAHLPAGATWTTSEVSSWLRENPSAGRLVAGKVLPQVEIPGPELLVRSQRSQNLRAEAEWAVSVPLRPAAWFARCIGVSGSVAYGLAEPEDDLDFFVVARAGGAWLFLLLAFLGSRRAHRRGTPAAPWCFNYVVEEGAIDFDLARPRGLLVAREALSVRVIRGAAYYRQVLTRAPWMATELPRMYAERTAGKEDPPRPHPLGWLARALNVLVFPVLATYLQLVGLVGNRRLRRESPAKCFGTETTLHRFQLRTEHFNELHRLYRSESATPSD